MTKNYDLENIISYVENLIAGFCVFQIKGKQITPLYLNEGCYRMLGYTHQELGLLLKHIEHNVISEDLPILYQGIADILKDDGPVEFAIRTVTLSGGLRWLQVNGNLYSLSGEEAQIVCVLLDITEKKAMEEEMLEQAERLNLIVESEQEIIVDYNAKTDVMMIRKISRNGMPKEKIIPKYFEAFDLAPYATDDVDELLSLYRRLLKKPGKGVMECRHKLFSEESRWYHIALSSISDMDGYVTRIVGRMLDIQDQKMKEMELTQKAERDSLSGLYNKGAVTDLITESILKSGVDTIHALMIVDLDNFKSVNDTKGHLAGDQLISQVGYRLIETFKGYDIIGRVGGDEFVVFMKDIETIANADILATKLLKELQEPYQLSKGEVSLTCSIGISVYPYHGVNYQELFDKADKAMYFIKDNGKNSYRIYDAAATRVFHASRREDRAIRFSEINEYRDLEDLVMDVLFEEKERQTAMEAVLELTATQYDYQQAYIYPEETSLRTNYTGVSFAAEGYEVTETLQDQLHRAAVFKSFYDHNYKLRIYHDYDTGLTEEQLRYLTEHQIHAILYYPLLVNGNYVGSIVYQRHTWKDITFEGKEQKDFRSIMRIIDTYTQNSGILSKVPNILTQIRLIDNLDNYVYVIDYNTKRLSFINKKVLDKTPDISLGEKCHKILRNSDTPCSDCVMMHLDKENPHSRCTEECFNYSTRSWMRMSASWLECTSEVTMCLLDCMDISEYFIGP